MKRHTAIFITLVALLCGHAIAAERKPNFLFIYAMGAAQQEQGERARFPFLKSPGMDRLAAEGVRFCNTFVTLSHCAPSRGAEVFDLAADTALTAKLDAELEKVAATVRYSPPANANRPKPAAR